MATEVACGWGSDEKTKPSYWAGVVKPLLNAKKTNMTVMDGKTDGWAERLMDGRMDGLEDGQIDGRMDGQQTERLRHGTTDIAGYNVACMRLKIGFNPETISKVHSLTYSPPLDWTVAKRRYISPCLFIVISF